jgi:hypothetical protein
MRGNHTRPKQVGPYDLFELRQRGVENEVLAEVPALLISKCTNVQRRAQLRSRLRR